jgi:hypothetical protein
MKTAQLLSIFAGESTPAKAIVDYWMISAKHSPSIPSELIAEVRKR